MNEPIKTGDLVQVARSCCDAHAAESPSYGAIGVVSGFNSGRLRCYKCGFSVACATWAEFGNGHEAYVPFLKRIPPLGELGDVKQDEEITA